MKQLYYSSPALRQIIPNVYLGLIRNYRADLDTEVIANCNPSITAANRIGESTTIKLAFKSRLDLEKALKAELTVDYEFYHVLEYKPVPRRRFRCPSFNPFRTEL